MRDVFDGLVPRPQSVELRPHRLALAQLLVLRLADPKLAQHTLRFQARLAALGHTVAVAGGARAAEAGATLIDIAIDPSAGDRAESYTLAFGERSIAIRGRDGAGVAHALSTLAQVVRIARAAPARSDAASAGDASSAAATSLPGAKIADWPDFPARGVLLDVSRTRVPTLGALSTLVEALSDLKVNQLQLYTEHTFAYAGHEIVWRDASPFDGAQIEALDRHCRAHGIELVPNQQSFGHMHRWLVHEPYRSLAEVPEGIEHAFSRSREPYGLCPTDPSSLALLEDLYDQLLPHFASRLFNVGLDETIDLGLGRSRATCAERGTARVYLDFLCAVEARVRARGRRMMFWGDILVRHPELCREIPRAAIALEWGYEAGHAFAERLHVFAESGLEFYVCPGTSSWQSVAGRTQNALLNLKSAAIEGRRAGARGFLVTDWGDRGHLQPLSATWPGLLAGAALAWNAGDEIERARLAACLDDHIFDDPARVLGTVVCELGDAYLETGSASTNGSALFFLLAFAAEPLPHARMPGLALDGLARALAYVVERRGRIEAARPRCWDAAQLCDEARWSADVLAFACRFGIARLRAPAGAPAAAIEAGQRQRLAQEIAALILEHRRLWNVRSRPGGLAESTSWLERVRGELVESADARR